MGCFEVSLGDTLGVGTPAQVRRVLGLLLQHVPADVLAGHFHDTYGQAVANTLAAYELGLRTFDSSVSGLGGCPYSPGAKGNLASEDIVYTFEQMGISTGVDLNALVRVGQWIAEQLGLPNGSRAGAALFSKPNTSKPDQGIQPIAVKKEKTAQQWQLVEDCQEYLVHRSHSTIKITLNRPKNGNALTSNMCRGIHELMTRISRDQSCFRIIITAHGKFFCTGMDLSSGGASSKSSEQNFMELSRLFEGIESAPQTTVALINGPAFGGGVGLAFACDIRLATRNSQFRLTEVRLGLCPAVISKYIFREWGIGFAREAIITARSVSARELYDKIGSIHGIADDNAKLDTLLEEYLDTLRACAPKASTESKILARAAWQHPGAVEQKDAIKRVFDTMMASEESRIAMDNFRRGIRQTDWEKVLQSQKSKL
jgi:hydroxymethylglutaryl-CoA lyase